MQFTLLIIPIRPLLLLSTALALSACIIPKVVGDSPLDGSSAGDTGSTTSEPVVTDGPPAVCANPAFTCTQPIDCEQWRCGAIDSPFDASGCLRPSCDDAPCGPNEVCYGISRSKDCAANVVGCADVDGTCSCQVDQDCVSSFCVPTDEGPPAVCPQITDKEACLAAGCSEFTTVVLTSVVDGACVNGELTPACLWFPGDAWGGTATPGTFYEQSTGAATYFATDWFQAPYGWSRCGSPDSPPACACLSNCAQRQQEASEFLDADQPCADVSDCVLADATCFANNTCGSVGVHKDSLSEWNQLHDAFDPQSCCSGADPCGGTLACQDQRCVVVFP